MGTGAIVTIVLLGLFVFFILYLIGDDDCEL